MFWTWIVLPFAFFWGLFAIHIIFLFVVGGLFGNDSPKKPSGFARFIVQETAFMLCHFFRIHTHVSGMGKVPKKRFMLINNHTSDFDDFCLVHVFAKHRVLYISKEANFHIPVCGNWIRRAGYISIIQEDMNSGAKVISSSAELIKNGSYSICVAPEGTRNKTFPDPMLLPFHNGTFNLAKEAHCPIVVTSIQNTYAMVRRFPLKSTHVYIDVVGVISEEDVEAKSTKELADISKAMIAKRFEEKGARFYHLDPKKENEKAKEKQ